MQGNETFDTVVLHCKELARNIPVHAEILENDRLPNSEEIMHS